MSAELAARAGELLALVRERRPRVHCITNSVVQELTANVLLAAGAIPSMTTSPEEIAHFAASADALLVNLGTLDGERRDAIDIALEVVRDDGIPWVLDPVLIDRSEPRAELARTLALKEPRVVRANAAEFGAHAPASPQPANRPLTKSGYARPVVRCISLSSAGVNRIRFDGLADASQPGNPDTPTRLQGEFMKPREWLQAPPLIFCLASPSR